MRKKAKYKVTRGNPSYELAWKASYKDSWVAEFTEYKDAVKFCAMKNKEK